MSHFDFLNASPVGGQCFPAGRLRQSGRLNPAENYCEEPPAIGLPSPAVGPVGTVAYECGNVSADGPAINPLPEAQLPVALRRVPIGERHVLVAEVDRDDRVLTARIERMPHPTVTRLHVRAAAVRETMRGRAGCVEGRSLRWLAGMASGVVSGTLLWLAGIACPPAVAAILGVGAITLVIIAERHCE